MVLTNPDAFATVDAKLFRNACFMVPHTDGSGGTALYTVNAPLAKIRIKMHRIGEFLVQYNFPHGLKESVSFADHP